MLNLADTPLLGTGEGPGFVAEQFTLDQVFGHRAAVDGNKVVGTAGAAFVNVPGQGILTGTGFTMQQHVCGNIQDRPDGRHYRLHRRRITQNPRPGLGQLPQLGLQAPVFQCQVPFFQGVPQQFDQLIVVKGLFNEVIGPLLHGRHRRADVALAGEQNHRDVFINLPYLVQQLHAIHARHVVVAQDDAFELWLHQLQRRCSVGKTGYRDIFQGEGLFHHRPDIRVIIHKNH